MTTRASAASGRVKTTVIRVLTTLLDHDAYPARDIAALYAGRWQIEIVFLHLKKTVRGARRALRGQSPALARQARPAARRQTGRAAPPVPVMGAVPFPPGMGVREPQETVQPGPAEVP